MISLSLIHDREGQTYKRALPEPLTPIREQHWKNSRMALEQSLQQLSQGSKALELPNSIDIEKHHHLKDNSNILVSLAHTRGAACATSAFKNQRLLGIGVDIEDSTRVVKEEIVSKYIDSRDKIDREYLRAWCAKEAAFKAASYFWRGSKTFILKDITIDLEESDFQIKGLLNGCLSFHGEDRFLICTAIVNNIIL
jgi:phosphopantetheinyl transferase (holo-ACP synthase)